ncbi:ATP-binding protein [Nocardia sp. NPDC050406]|uniref:ATP-binding protein n=1 Tax=Nocardia sp. NPDC050406 TaxID=3364318 RepID=UPI0037AA4723
MVRPYGELNPGTYRMVTDDLVKFAVEQPHAVIVVLDSLRIASYPLLTAFSSARIRVEQWPRVPIMLVVGSEIRRAEIRSTTIGRLVPIFGSVPAALAHTAAPPPPRRANTDLPLAADCAQRSRRFVDDICTRWNIADLRCDARLVATELVENAFLHSRSHTRIRLRLERRDDLLTVAVADDDPREAVLREPTHGSPHLYGLHVVARLSHAWGCAPPLANRQDRLGRPTNHSTAATLLTCVPCTTKAARIE